LALLERGLISRIGLISIGACLLSLGDGLIGGFARDVARIDSLVERAIPGNAGELLGGRGGLYGVLSVGLSDVDGFSDR
jgi:hypothetical protein